MLESSYMLRLVKKCTLLECGGVAGDFGMGTHCCIGQNTAFIPVLWLFHSLSEHKDKMEAAASSGMGDLLAGVSLWPSSAQDLNS